MVWTLNHSYRMSSPIVTPFTRLELDSECWIDQGMLPDYLVDTDFDELWDLHPEEYGQVMMWGKLLNTPRWQKSYGRNYIFSGMDHEADELPDAVAPFLDWANSLSPERMHPGPERMHPGPERMHGFNQTLLNWYQNGHHYIGYHSDDERQLIPNSPIISLSLGAERKFRIRQKGSSGPGPIVKDILMPYGTVFIMGGKMQKRYTHEVVKIQGEKGKNVGKRVNITFRQFK